MGGAPLRILTAAYVRLIKASTQSLSRLNLSRLFKPQIVDRLVAQNVLAYLSRDGPGSESTIIDILRDFEVGDLTLQIVLQLFRRARSLPP